MKLNWIVGFVKNKLFLISILISLFLAFLLLGYFFPNSLLASLLNYFNSISSFVIVLLTLIYVITTSRQLNVMRSQINVMEKSFNLQVQPLPIPIIKKAYLEKLQWYSSPEDDFSSVHLMYRFHHDIEVTNAGTGAVLNMTAFTTLIPQKDVDFPNYFHEAHIHCIGTNPNDRETISIMGLDKQHEMLKAILDHNLVLQTDFYYKNIFGAGFHERVAFLFILNDENEKRAKSWLDFLENDLKNYDTDLKRYEALIKKVPNDAQEILKKIKKEISDKFSEEISISNMLAKQSFRVSFIDYDEAISKMEESQKKIHEKYYENKRFAPDKS
jgi:hypothetical protein